MQLMYESIELNKSNILTQCLSFSLTFFYLNEMKMYLFYDN